MEYGPNNTINIFASDNSSRWWWYQFNTVFSSVSAPIDLGIFQYVQASGDKVYLLDSNNTRLTVSNLIEPNDSVTEEKTIENVTALLFVGIIEGTKYLYYETDGAIEIDNSYNTPAPENDSEHWQTIAKGVSFNLAGVWSNQTYNKFDIVNYNGSSYISKIDQTSASTPENDSTNWQLFAQ